MVDLINQPPALRASHSCGAVHDLPIVAINHRRLRASDNTSFTQERNRFEAQLGFERFFLKP